MSGHWEGFTEEDIRKIGIGGTKATQKRTSQVVKQPAISLRPQAKKNDTLEKMLQNLNEPNILSERKPLMTDPSHGSLPSCIDTENLSAMNCSTELTIVPLANPDSVLNTTLPSSCPVPLDNPDSILNTTLPSSSPVPLANPDSVLNTTPSSISPNHIPVCIRIKEGRSYEVIESQKTSLEDFQKRQKLMEEQNRHRKELLGRALADRKKQTHAEAQRLQQIQEELQKLDTLLSNDVSILRNQIEVASLEFNEAQKRYNKAEKEFLDAKMTMYGKLEQKELLTGHLCTIIEQNEMRKAKKLSELMDKLELGTVMSSEVINENQSTLSNKDEGRDEGVLTNELTTPPVDIIHFFQAPLNHPSLPLKK